jgi:hypothetical protein
MISSGSLRCLTPRTGGDDLTPVPPREPAAQCAGRQQQVRARVIAPPSWPVTCADVPAAGHFRPACRGSHAGTLGPPRHRRPVRWPHLALRDLEGVPTGRRVPLLHETLATRIGRKAWSCSGNWLAATDESRQWSGSRSGLLAGSACPMAVGVYPFRALGRWVG